MMEIRQILQIDGISEKDKNVLNDFSDALITFCNSHNSCTGCPLHDISEDYMVESCPAAFRAILDTFSI